MLEPGVASKRHHRGPTFEVERSFHASSSRKGEPALGFSSDAADDVHRSAAGRVRLAGCGSRSHEWATHAGPRIGHIRSHRWQLNEIEQLLGSIRTPRHEVDLLS